MPIIGVIDSAKSGNLYAASFDSIATVTLASPQLGLTFSSIPATYTHLQVRGLSRSASGAPQAFWIRYNGDSTSGNYAWHYVTGNGTTAAAGKEQPSSVNLLGTIPSAAQTSGIFGATVFDILDYANTNKYKTVRALSGYDANGSGDVWFGSGLWLSTAAVNSIYIQDSSTSNFVAGTTFALYGIKVA